MHVSLHICIYLCYVKPYREIFYIILFWSECSALLPLCPFIGHPLSKFTLRPWCSYKTVFIKKNVFDFS